MKALALLIPIALSASVFAQEAKHIMTTSCAGLPESADFSVKPMGYEFGIKLDFIIEGKNLIGIDDESLTTEDSGWKLAPFSKTNDENTLASFAITKAENLFGKESEAKVKGSLKVITASKSDTKTFTLESSDAPVDCNGLKVSLKLDGNSFGNGILVEGDFQMIQSIEVMQDGKKLNRGGSSWSGDRKTYSFSDLKEGCEVIIKYWTDLDTKTVSFQKS